jgi:hypothetical protein
MVTTRAIWELSQLLNIVYPAELASSFQAWTSSWQNHAYHSNLSNKEYRELRLKMLEWLEPHFRHIELKTGHLVSERQLTSELRTLRRIKRWEQTWKDLSWFNKSMRD